jgi:hypothetical protein
VDKKDGDWRFSSFTVVEFMKKWLVGKCVTFKKYFGFGFGIL